MTSAAPFACARAARYFFALFSLPRDRFVGSTSSPSRRHTPAPRLRMRTLRRARACYAILSPRVVESKASEP